MSKKQNEASEKLERLCNALTDEIDAMSDEELLAELEEVGEDANDIANRTAGVIRLRRYKRWSSEAGGGTRWL